MWQHNIWFVYVRSVWRGTPELATPRHTVSHPRKSEFSIRSMWKPKNPRMMIFTWQ